MLRTACDDCSNDCHMTRLWWGDGWNLAIRSPLCKSDGDMVSTRTRTNRGPQRHLRPQLKALNLTGPKAETFGKQPCRNNLRRFDRLLAFEGEQALLFNLREITASVLSRRVAAARQLRQKMPIVNSLYRPRTCSAILLTVSHNSP